MTTPAHPEEVLRDQILADARHEAEAIVERARQAAQALLAKATAEADQALQARLDQARAEATRRKDLILASVPVETGRMRAARVEAVLESVRQEVLLRLVARAGFDYRQALITLVAEAVNRMTGDAFVVKLSPKDRDLFADGLAEEIARRAARGPLRLTVLTDPAITEDGVIVAADQGRQLWDDRLPSRLARLWPELRRQIAARTGLVADRPEAGGTQ
jgi:V/A-type H+-transporting ATPase subunit E